MLSNEKGLFKEAKEAKVLPNIFMGILWTILFVIGGEIIGGILDYSVKTVIGDNPTMLRLSSLILEFIFITLLVFARVKYREKRTIASLGLKREGFISRYLIGYAVGLVMFSTVVIILKITGHIEINHNPTTPSGMAALGAVLIIIPGWMIQSGTEEILTRGWLMNVLGARYNVATGLIISSSIFGILHGLNTGVTILAIINIILVGLFLGIYVIRTNNIWGVCGLHAAWNWSQGNIFGFAVSGQSADTGSLMHLKLIGAEWFTGGSFGPEAGVASTVVLLLGILIVCLIPIDKIKAKLSL